MKTLSQIKDQVAQDNGFGDWDSLINYEGIPTDDFNDLIDEVVFRYTEQMIEEDRKEHGINWIPLSEEEPEENRTVFWCTIPTVEPPYIGSYCDVEHPDWNDFTHWAPIRNSFFPDGDRPLPTLK